MSLGGPSRDRGIGRSRELATAAFARDTARAGMGSVLAVTGVQGSGKTWLCETIAEVGADEGFRVGWGSGWPDGGVPDLWPWQQAVASFGATAAASEVFAAPPEVDSPDWFTHCVAVVDHLRALTADQPSILIIDDAHTADEATQRLAYFVARHVRGLQLVLVVAHEPCEALSALNREATAIALHGFGPDDTAAVLSARGIDGLTSDDLGFVVAATGGLPRELHRLANSADDGPGVVQALVDQRLADLPTDVVRGAAFVAVLDDAPRLGDDTAPVPLEIEIDPVVVDELGRVGLATRQLPDGLVFSHRQVRETLVTTLDADEALHAHARATGLLAAGPPSVDRLHRRARHALAAARRSVADARLAVDVSRDAAAALIDANHPEAAAEVLAAAEAVHVAAGLGSAPAGLLAAHGSALLRCGWLAASRDQFRRAATAADEEGDAISLALAALGLGGVWLAEERSPIDRERFFSLLVRAHEGLPADEAKLRLRLDVRLAAEDAYATGDFEPIEAQVTAARATGDPAVLAEALSLYHHTLLGPEHRGVRSSVVDELLSVATQADDHAMSLMALLWLTADQFLAGSPQAERTLRGLHDRADALTGRHAAYIASVMDVMLLQRAGRLDEAERAAEAAFAVGTKVGDADAVAYYGGQLVTLRWIQGRADEVLELTAQTEASPTITPANQAFTACLASLAASCGELDQARAALSRLKGRLDEVHQSSAWLVTLYSVVEAAHILDDAAAAGEAAALLAPYADVPVVGSLGVSCIGSVRRALGLAAVTAGDLDAGIVLLEAAVADNERLGNRPLAAISVADVARARARRGGDGDREAAFSLLSLAIREAEAMDLPARAQEWDAVRAALGSPGLALRPAAGLDAEVGTIQRRGRSWVLGVGGRSVVVPDLLGMGYLVQLLTNPGVEIAAAALVSPDASVSLRPEQPVLDETALAAYRQRVTELEDDLAEAERHADSERAARARIELDAVVDELTRTTNRFGKARAFSSSNERARTAVQKAVRRTLDHIATVDPVLGTALRRSVRTGRTCCYEPGPGAPGRWERVDAAAASPA